eukprot:1293999-Alexandrium_andersonii.AAC.1
MSASLVGSEMCIRDSLKPGGTLPRSFVRAFLRRSLLRDLLASLPGAPVSYTHLTLPTICSV